MPRQRVPKQVRDDIDFYLRTKAGKTSWEQSAQEWYEFAIMNKMWTEEEKNVLKARGQSPLVVNRLKPIVRSYQSYLGAKSPAIRAIPTRMDIGAINANKISEVFNQLFGWIWYNSDADEVSDQVIEDFLVRGVGYFHVYYDKYDRDGKGNIKICKLHPSDIFVDLNSKRKDFQDATKQIISKEITVTEAKNRLPEYKRKITEAVNLYVTMDNYTTTDLHSTDNLSYADEVYDQEEDRIRIFDVYEKKNITMYDVVNAKSGDYYQLTSEEFDIFKEEAKDTNMEYVFKKTYLPRVHRRFSVGDIPIGDEEILPTGLYPNIPVIFQHLNNTLPMSLVADGKDLNKEVNKRRSLMISYATSGAGGKRILYEEGAVGDKEEFEESYARPAGATPVLDINKIKEIDPTPLPPALVQLESFAKNDMEYVLGVPAQSMGLTENAHETYKGVIALDEFAKRNLSPSAKTYYSSLTKLGKVVIDFIQGYMRDTNDLIRLVQPYDNPTEEFREVLLNQPVYDDKTGALLAIQNDVTVGRYDVQVIPGSTYPDSQGAMLQMMYDFYTAGIVDDIEVYKHVPIFDKQGLIQRKSALANIQRVSNEQAQAIEEMSRELDSLTKILKDEKMSHEITKWKAHLKDVSNRYKRSQDELNTQMKRASQELKIEQKRIKVDKKES